jgi:hypothetical protein
MGVLVNPNLSLNKFVMIMALKPNEVQVTAIATQVNAIIEQYKKFSMVFSYFF